MEDEQYDQEMEEAQYEEDYYEENYDDYDLGTMVRNESSANAQYEMKNLKTKIISEVQDINDLTNLGFDWSFMLFYACGWKKDLVKELVLTKEQKHKSLIHYLKEFNETQGEAGKGECGVCGEDNLLLLRNLCGHEFCVECWKEHLITRLETSFQDPFPPCIMGEGTCNIRMSNTLCETLSEKNEKIKDKFREVLCRSYAVMSTEVKICKGREGFSCNKCFTVTKMFDVIECDTCGNLVCPRCGDRAHGPSNCFDYRNWRELTESSLEFVEFLNYRICPHCKEAVERSLGCNSMICKCKQEFCFVCGEKWLPNHKAHGDQTCPRYKEITALNEQKKKRNENEAEFYYKIQERKDKLDVIIMKFKRVEDFKKKIKEFYAYFLKAYSFYESQLKCLEDFCSFLLRALCFFWGQILAFHFCHDQAMEFLCMEMDKHMQKIFDFLFQIVEKAYILGQMEEDKMCSKEKKELKQLSENFVSEFLKHSKECEQISDKVKKQIESLVSISS